MFAGVGGGELRVCVLNTRPTGLAHTAIELSLMTLFSDILGTKLLPALPSASLNHKQPNTVHFVAGDTVLISLVDMHPSGQSSIL